MIWGFHLTEDKTEGESPTNTDQKWFLSGYYKIQLLGLNPRKLRHKKNISKLHNTVLETGIFNSISASRILDILLFMAVFIHLFRLNPAWALNHLLENLLYPLSPVFPSDSVESAQREICFFFPEFCVEEWMRTEESLFRSGQIHYDCQKLTHTLLPHSWPQICCYSHSDWGLFAQYTEQMLDAT